MQKKSLPQNVLNFINQYFLLNINGEIIECPYYINTNKNFQKPVFAGKGTPEEIIEETIKIIDNNDSKDTIRAKMKENDLGIDCSGLVYHILNFQLKENYNKNLVDYLPKISLLNLKKFISRKKTPQKSVSADDFTSEPFSKRIDIATIEPGDLIRTRGGKHLLLVTEVFYDQNNKPVELRFVNSVSKYVRDGVRYGRIVLSEDLNLSTSSWYDDDENEPENFAYAGWRENINTNGVFRPKILV